MKIFKSINEINTTDEVVCALGNFDGVHRGHQELISTAVKLAKEKGLKAAVFTFTEHPINVMSGSVITKTILNFDDKAEILEAMGVDYLFSIDFADVRSMSPEEFVKDLLVTKLHVKHTVCGFNFTFGYKASGNHEDLKAFGKIYDYEATIIEPVQVDGITVSSTLIRGCIEKGDVESYLSYTGRVYMIYGTVIEGEHNGRKMGFPTVNLNLDSSMALPANGVYFTRTYVGDKLYPSITNVGNKPTIGTFAKNAETHIFNFTENAYGMPIKVDFLKMHRAEQRFENMEILAKQIDSDCLAAKNYHKID
ncbi:MAG: bifunctional riboflavin kinase/FAD synthetase [Bacillota bacterium]|nr:bifunctional riboflavin kinase/FAD synthetase [Bacillota bacterium]